MLHLLSAHHRGQVELLQVLSQELVHSRDVLVLHGPQARSLGSLQKVGQVFSLLAQWFSSPKGSPTSSTETLSA